MHAASLCKPEPSRMHPHRHAGSSPWAGALGCWAARGSRARAFPELPALLYGRPQLSAPISGYCWNRVVIQLIKLHLARKAERTCSTKATHTWMTTPPPPGELCYHCHNSAISGHLLWSSPGTGPQVLGLLGISAAISPTIAIVAAICPN